MEIKPDENTRGEMEKTDLQIIAFGRGCVIAADKFQPFTRWGQQWVHVPEGTTIRRWGTSNGLGELGVKGVTEGTVLDAIPYGIDIPLAAIHGIWLMSPGASTRAGAEIEKVMKSLLAAGGK